MSTNVVAPGTTLTAQRIQYRVGHGGFHATIVKDSVSDDSLVYVYDVGACPDVFLLEDAIDRFVARLIAEGIGHIQYVILSHIDEDHVNRLNYLLGALKNKVTVGTLTLPWLRNASRLLALNRAPRRDPSTVVYRLLQDDHSIAEYATALGFKDVLFVTGESNDDTDDDDLETVSSTPRSGAATVSYSASGVSLAVPKGLPWTLLITHLEPPEETLLAFDQHVRSTTTLDPSKQSDHDDLIENHKREIREAMRFASRKTNLKLRAATVSNWSSQSLYSASHSPLVRHGIPHAPDDFEMRCVHGWLHTGDLPLDVPEVWDAFERAWNRHLSGVELCALVAPHHGSLHGHNQALYNRFKPSAVVFTLGLWLGSRRGRPMFAKLIKPKTALKSVRSIPGTKVRVLNNRV